MMNFDSLARDALPPNQSPDIIQYRSLCWRVVRDKEGAFFETLVLLLFSGGVAWVHPLRGEVGGGGGHQVLSETEIQIYHKAID